MSACLAEKILWSPPFEDPLRRPQDESPSGDAAITSASPPFVFPDEILSEARALTSYAFSHVVQMASIEAHESFPDDDHAQNAKPHSQPIISLYYPHHGCHNIIDSMVKSLARDQGADVVVLDSLELALQEFGAFGKEFARATDVLYNVRDNHSRDDHIMQSIFNNIIDIRQKPDAPHENSNAVEQSSPRIVYMRDFGSIAPSASLLIPYLLQALRTRRTARFQKNSLGREEPLQPTVLIFGFSETPNIKPEGKDGRGDADRVSKDFSNGGTALIQILPPLDSKLFTLKNETFPTSAFSSAFFLPSLTNAGELSTQSPAIKAPPIKHFMSGTAAIFVFPVDGHTEEFRNIEQRMACSRNQAVRNAWMTTDEQSTPNLSDILAPIDFLDELHKRTGLLPPVSLDRIASIAVGLSSPGSSAPRAAIQVTPASVSRACQLFVKNLQARSDWTKMVMGHEEHEKEEAEDEDETEDEDEDEEGAEDEDKMPQKKEQAAEPIVQKVKEATDLNEYERKLLNGIVDGAKLETRFEDVCIPGNIIDSLRTVVSLPLLHPSAFKVGILGREAMGGVLLYGPPGTGKTLVCRALARECGARMLQVKPSDIMDCYVGESEKLAKAIFSLAYRLAPCVIFIDELDSLFKARSGKDDRQYQRNILNEFLQSMDGLQSAGKNKDCGVVIIGATNRPHDLDDAILRRLATRLMVTLPDEDGRECTSEILRLHLRDEQLGEDVDLHNIASKTDYYSGSDLKALCVSAAMASVKDSVDNFSWTSHIPSSGTGGTPDQVSGEAQSKLHTRTITLNNFAHAMNEVPPSSSAGGHSELLRWHDQFGRKGTLDKRSGAKPQINGHPETRTYSENGERRYNWK
ncbi:hypothetical protein PILCRDRAFT_12910 [Piloderma croceum F 1598]|uniref:AAA+ ATPase domain-containing protein n=1 Tax=Piloderma croceum (strain F 1598) TaxID=765440 RepID=A0A0C3BG32_PILCF|nr:hypothetical protein PILCRDRAFT_12910 [Piloderma croceum F 1598]